MILLLVIAILVLLALLGTAYILMARADKHSTYAANAAANLNLAQKGVLNLVRSTMLYQTVDGTGSMLGANYGYYSSTVIYPLSTTATPVVVEVSPNFGTASPATYVTTYYESLVANNAGNPPATSPADWQQILAARCYDYPESTLPYNPSATYYGGELVSTQAQPWGVYQVIPATVTGVPPGTGPSWQPVPAQGWLVGDLPMEPSTNYAYGQTALWNGVQYVCTTTPTVTPQPPLPTPPSTSNWQPAGSFFGAPSAQVNYYSGLAPEAYDPSTGGYDLQYANGATASVVQPSVVHPATGGINAGNAYPYGTRDALWQMLPYSSPNGTRYRFAVRIIDANSMLNLNAGSAGSVANPSGQYFNGAQLDGAMVMAAADVSAGYTLHIINGNGGSANGRAGTASALDTPGANFLANWANELFTYQAPQTPGVQWYSLATELELRSYGNSGGGFNGGTPYYGRPLQLWPNTLGYPSGLAAANRDFYTTYSWDRSFRRIVDIPSVTIGGTTYAMPTTLGGATTCASPSGTATEQVWPAFPQKIWVNGPSVATAAEMPTQAAKTATDLARVMLSCGYSGPEAVAFAANYMNYMYDAGTLVQDNGSSTANAYKLASPSFIDGGADPGIGNGAPGAAVAGNTNSYGGICIRGQTDANFTTPATSATSTDLTSNIVTLPAGTTLPTGITQPDLLVTGYAAQPFILEAAVNTTGTSAGTPTYNQCAIELYNPYGAMLDVSGWEIGVLNGTGTGYSTVYTIPAGIGIPANGYLAVESGVASPTPFAFEGSPPPAQILTATASTGPLAFSPTVTSYGDAVLLRPFVTRAGAAGYLPVDEFSVVPFTTAASAANYYLSRFIDTYTVNDPWGCANALQQTTAATSEPGIPPTTPPPPFPATFPAIPLYDRFADQTDQLNTAIAATGDLPGYAPGSAPTPAAPLLNIADFNRITRLISVSALSGSVYVPIQMISQTIANLANPQTPTITDPQDSTNTYFLKYEPYARFDFLQPTNATPPDPRALDILKMITMTNPASDPDLNQNSATLDAIRMAGRINVNTASLPVLEDILVSTEAGSTPAQAQSAAEQAIDLRDRVAPGFASAPGSGISSMGALLSALAGFSYSTGGGWQPPALPATTLDNRDWTWATIYNMCSVRSDTFVVYGLIQALRLNGNYSSGSSPGTYQATDWYTANQGVVVGASPTENTISTDPDNTAAEYILQGQRRFVAIIDRSYCNLGPNQPNGSDGATSSFFQLPKVVAVKVLPN